MNVQRGRGNYQGSVRKRVAKEDRRRLIEEFKKPNGDFLKLASILNINNQTAFSILRKFKSSGAIDASKVGGRQNIKVDEDMREEIKRIVDSCLLYTSPSPRD